MPYVPYHADWRDHPDETTPVTAAALEHIEGGIVTVSEQADDTDTALSTLSTDTDAALNALATAVAAKLNADAVSAFGLDLIGSDDAAAARTTLEIPDAQGAGQGFFSTIGDNWAYAMVAGATVAWSLANRAVYTKVTPARDMVISKLTWRFTSTGTNYDMGIYDAVTLARLWSKGSTPIPTPGVVNETVSPAVSLTAGHPYLVAVAFDGLSQMWSLNVAASARDVAQFQIDGASGQSIQNAAFPLPNPAVPSPTNVLAIPVVILKEA